ncbi:uncharacterized protein LOC134202346 [Armigeres subalbatus]|uniref:uncharacterized protein LOC134202346 n=1 Tax=Armigeres subalbatus TaxID=124917 RepID=UPI002ED20004
MERIVRPAAGLTALYYLRDFLIRGKSRRWWVRPSNQYRSTEGYFETDYDRMRQRDPDYFQESIRMSPSTFDLLLRKVRSRLEKFSFRRPISPACRLFLTLMYLAHGTPVAIMAIMFKMGESTIRNITMEVSDVLWEVLVRDYLPVPLEEDFRRYAEEFKEKWKFPNCCGAIDGKHVAIQCPPNAGSTFYNYKGYHSIVLMGLCNANYEFLMVDIGAFGGNSDGGIFSNCIFGQLLLQNQVGLL